MSILRLFVVCARDAKSQQRIERDLCELTANMPAEAGYEACHVLSQEDGLMVGFVSQWASREHAERFQEGALNSLLTAFVEMEIVGTPVVKLFRMLESANCKRRVQ
jgi:hypothetical protein